VACFLSWASSRLYASTSVARIFSACLMKSSFVIVGALLVGGLIALQVTSRKDGTATQRSQDAQPQKKSPRDRVTIRPRADPAAPGLAATQTNGTLTTNEINGIPLATYLEQWRAHYE